jgi:hypothetical protein
MRRDPEPAQALDTLKRLRWFVAAVLAVPAGTLALSFGLAAINQQAGWQRVALPGVIFWVYGAAVVGSPLVGLSVLAVLALRREELWRVSGAGEVRVRDRVTVLGVMAVLAPAIWLVLAPFVYFAAGGSR